MKRVLALAAVVLVLVAATANADEDANASAAAAYEHLAAAIIEINATEDALVAGILSHYYAEALDQLRDAQSMKMTSPHVEAAADLITAIANEGDKKVQAIRQRLLQSGHHHHHHNEAETPEDYVWIDSKEKKAFLDLAGKVARIKNVDEISGRMDELSRMFKAAMQPE